MTTENRPALPGDLALPKGGFQLQQALDRLAPPERGAAIRELFQPATRLQVARLRRSEARVAF